MHMVSFETNLNTINMCAGTTSEAADVVTDFQQGMELVSSCKINTVTENYWLAYAAATRIWHYHVGYYFQSLS